MSFERGNFEKLHFVFDLFKDIKRHNSVTKIALRWREE